MDIEEMGASTYGQYSEEEYSEEEYPEEYSEEEEFFDDREVLQGPDINMEGEFSDLKRTSEFEQVKDVSKFMIDPVTEAKNLFLSFPFDFFKDNKKEVVGRLEIMKDLNFRNMPLMISAILFWIHYPKDLNKINFNKFYKNFKDVMSEVDLLRYIMLVKPQL